MRLILLFVLSLNVAFANRFDRIQFMTEEYPPYNFMEKGELKGISIDLLVATLKKLGSNQGKNNFRYLPWIRAYKNAQVPGLQNVVFSTTRSKDREKLFKWAGPIKAIHIDAFAKKHSDLVINSEEELHKYTYVAIRGDIGELVLLNKGVDKKRIETSVKFDSVLKMLFIGRVDMMSYASDVAYWLTKKSGYNTSDIKPVYRLHSSDVYFAFNLAVPDDIVAEFQKALDEVKSDEEFLKNTFNKYLK